MRSASGPADAPPGQAAAASPAGAAAPSGGPPAARWTVRGPERLVWSGPDFDVVLVPIRTPSGAEFDHHVVRVRKPRYAVIAVDPAGSVWLRARDHPQAGLTGWELPTVSADPGGTPLPEHLPSNGLSDRRCLVRIVTDWDPAPGDVAHTTRDVRNAIAAGAVVDGTTLYALLQWLLSQGADPDGPPTGASPSFGNEELS